ncbi:MAG: DUF1694 domain-containing protein [Firmicutes bacterium]|nr:DUF1694 domain-containing protein [Bacillota bacterium]
MPDSSNHRSGGFSSKDPLEQTLLVGMHGTPELKKEERRRFLGQFRERVIKALTFDQISEPGTYPEVEAAIADPAAAKLIISRRADIKAAAEYIRLARQHQLSFTTVDSSDLAGPVGLVVAAESAVDREQVLVPSRVERLEQLGLPRALIDAKGQPVCKKCIQLLREKAPEELSNYRTYNLLDKLSGKKCICE